MKFMESRYLRELQHRNPALFDEMMLKRLGFVTDTKDPLQITLKTLRGLQDAGLVDDPKNIGNRQWIKDLAPLLPGLLSAFGGGVPQPQGYQPPAQHYQPSQPAVTAPSGTAQIAAPSPNGKAPPSVISQQVIKVLEPMTPAEGATWLLSQKVPFATWFTDQLGTWPDDQLPALLTSTAAQLPDIAGLMDWLGQRPEWVVELAHEIRKARKLPEPASP
jgi:hypothetical protein